MQANAVSYDDTGEYWRYGNVVHSTHKPGQEPDDRAMARWGSLWVRATGNYQYHGVVHFTWEQVK